MTTRATTTALVVTVPWRMNVRRRPTRAETMAIARAFSDGDFTGERRAASKGAVWLPRYLSASCLESRGAQYATIRDYLIDEHDADPRIAASVALQLTAPPRYTA